MINFKQISIQVHYVKDSDRDACDAHDEHRDVEEQNQRLSDALVVNVSPTDPNGEYESYSVESDWDSIEWVPDCQVFLVDQLCLAHLLIF